MPTREAGALDAGAAIRAAPGRPGLLAVAGAFLRRDLAVLASYRLTFALRLVSTLLVLASFAFLARFVARGVAAPARYGGAGYLGFWLVGLLASELFHALASGLAGRIREAQLEGTLEAMLATPAPAAWIVLSAPLAGLATTLVRFVLLAVAGVLLFGVRFGPVNAATLALAVPLMLLAFAALGLLGGAMTMVLRRTDPVTAIVGLAVIIVGGVLYPIDVLPAWLRPTAYALPLAPGLEALRLALFAGASPGDVAIELAAVGGFALVVAPLGAWLFAWALRRARIDGSLGQY